MKYLAILVLLAMALSLVGCDVVKADLEYKAAQAQSSAAWSQAMAAQFNADATKAEASADKTHYDEDTQRMQSLLAYLASQPGRASQDAFCYWAFIFMAGAGLLGVTCLVLWSKNRSGGC